ncbi:MAG TPA: maleylpyruvate isomerase family mycothiol-dependent enzyme [Actinomycetota bacterium]|nr:maleylpyruvate isomerase family mycothiol-dependent enzyme [Actinomycetota bacterium]
MPDASQLDDLDPFELLATERARLDRFFSGLDEAGWDRPTRCTGWRAREMIAHLAGGELYNQACLDDKLGELFERAGRAGAEGFQGFTDWTVSERAGRPPTEVLDEWRRASSDTLRRLREHGRDGTIPTSAGPYPAGLQAFHLAIEDATHADDLGAPVDPDEAADRLAWRATVSRFGVTETGKPVELEARGDRMLVRSGGQEAALSQDELVQAAVARLDADHPLPAGLREALRAFA